MRHKYTTTGMVLARTPLAEASLFVHFLTPDLGLVRARVQGVRKPAAKLSAALQTLSEADATLVHGKEGWRMSNAVLVENWFRTLDEPRRLRAGRIASLLLRLVTGEFADPELYVAYREFLLALPSLSETEQDAAECLAALRIVSVLGFDGGEMPPGGYAPQVLETVRTDRHSIITRINNGLGASGL